MVEDALREPGISGEGLRAICIREVQKDLKESSKLLIEDKLSAFRLGEADGFRIYKDVIQTPRDGLIIFKGMNDYTAESVKSLEKFKRAWMEEAQTITERSLSMLRPTIRAPGSQLWASWNSRRKKDAIDDFLRQKRPDNAIIVQANWRDNPWWNSELEAERQLDLKLYPERYDHIWEGDYAKAFEGAYFAKQLSQAKLDGRIGKVEADPLLPIRAYFDLGGSGAQADAMAIWICQFVGLQIRVLDYIEGVGQVLAYYVNELRQRGYGGIECVLPHDGINENNITGKRYEDHLRDAEFSVRTIPNQGRGAAALRVEAVRRILPKCWFADAATESGRDALGYYHERKDETRNVGLGPEHDWSSHCFIGETPVLTRFGMRRIMDLPETGKVLTPCGWKWYRNPRITRRNAPLVEVTFGDGLSVKCTPDHMFATASGWKSASKLLPGSLIRSTLTPSRRISMGASIAAGRVSDIGRAAVERFTGMYGRLLSVLFPKVATFITVTAITTITESQISNACQLANISRASGTTIIRDEASLMRPASVQQIGTARMMDVHGIADMLSAPKAGRNGSAKKRNVQTAKRHSWLSCVKAAIRKFGAPFDARQLRIASVEMLNETADVWCLTVPGTECFSLANGAIVHNCADAFGLMAIAYEEPSRTRQFSRKISYPQMGAV